MQRAANGRFARCPGAARAVCGAARGDAPSRSTSWTRPSSVGRDADRLAAERFARDRSLRCGAADAAGSSVAACTRRERRQVVRADVLRSRPAGACAATARTPSCSTMRIVALRERALRNSSAGSARSAMFPAGGGGTGAASAGSAASSARARRRITGASSTSSISSRTLSGRRGVSDAGLARSCSASPGMATCDAARRSPAGQRAAPGERDRDRLSRRDEVHRHHRGQAGGREPAFEQRGGQHQAAEAEQRGKPQRDDRRKGADACSAAAAPRLCVGRVREQCSPRVVPVQSCFGRVAAQIRRPPEGVRSARCATRAW